MTYRSRPAPRRRHRARWQDELRTQRLLVAAFASAIAIALGLFGAATWNAYFDAHLRQVMWVEGTAVSQEAFDLRQAMIGAELQATYVDLSGLQGGARDAVIQQQLSVIADQLQNLTTTASGSLVDGIFQATRADRFGITVAQEEIEAEIADRQRVPARVRLSLIEIDALPADAPAGTEPTEEDFARAQEEAAALREELDRGADFAALAAEQSDDPGSAATDGLVGWVEEDDVQYGELLAVAGDAEAGELVGPARTDAGWVVLRIEDRTPAGPFTPLLDVLSAARISSDDYRAYVADDLLRRAFRAYFEDEVVVTPAPQREVAQILVLNDQGVPVPKLRIRHLLAQPLPGAEDQSTASEAEWAAALARAEAWSQAVQDPDADWFALAEESDDPGTRNDGGDLGWYDPASGQFVAEFEAAVAGLAVGEISEPVRTDFGYHVIQVTDQRTTALDFAEQLIARLQADPDSFVDEALANSEDSSTRSEGGYAGWVARYEETVAREEAIFGLTEIGQISDQPVVDGNRIWIFKLMGTSESRLIEEDRLSTIRSVGYSRWYDELKAEAQIWIDSRLQLDAAATG